MTMEWHLNEGKRNTGSDKFQQIGSTILNTMIQKHMIEQGIYANSKAHKELYGLYAKNKQSLYSTMGTAASCENQTS